MIKKLKYIVLILNKMRSNLDNYIEDIQLDIDSLQNKLDEFNKRIFKWGKESEINLIKFILDGKKKLLEEARQYKRKLVAVN